MHGNIIDLTGATFGEWSVLGFAEIRYRTAFWRCRCGLCGAEKNVDGRNLRSGKTRCCGCASKGPAPKHGDAKRINRAPEYDVYHQAKARCNNPKHAAFANYGGRDIRFEYVSYADFIDDLGYRPSSKYSLERDDNNGNYRRGNCRWATRKEQQNNRRCTRRPLSHAASIAAVQQLQQMGLL